MIDILKKAYFEAFQETLGVNLDISTNSTNHGYISEIKILADKEIPVYTVFQKEMLIDISSILLFDDNPDEDSLEDLSKEMTNIVVGVAKVVGSRENVSFNISTPTFLGITKIDTKIVEEISFCYKDSICTAVIGG